MDNLQKTSLFWIRVVCGWSPCVLRKNPLWNGRSGQWSSTWSTVIEKVNIPQPGQYSSTCSTVINLVTIINLVTSHLPNQQPSIRSLVINVSTVIDLINSHQPGQQILTWSTGGNWGGYLLKRESLWKDFSLWSQLVSPRSCFSQAKKAFRVVNILKKKFKLQTHKKVLSYYFWKERYQNKKRNPQKEPYQVNWGFLAWWMCCTRSAASEHDGFLWWWRRTTVANHQNNP